MTRLARVLSLAIPTVAALVAGAGRVEARASAPPWLQQAAAATLTAAQAAAPAVVLLDDRAVTVSPGGEAGTRHLYAARINTREGRLAAALSEVYLTDGGRIRQARGWVISLSGEVREIDKDAIVDLALARNDVYNEARVRVVNAVGAEPGGVFGAEIVTEARSVFTQFEWPLQDRWPVKTVRRSLTVPAGWKVNSVTFNHAGIEPAVSGSSWRWELGELPAIEDEPDNPPLFGLVPRVAVGYVPSPPVASLPAFSEWRDVSRWLASVGEGQAVADPALTAKARQLTAGAATEIETIRAIGAYVQHVTYISIQVGMGRGGGYRPHAAADVFARNHGDCKDKSNLMRAMLAAVGIRSYLVSVFAGDRDYVRETWPSPQQFNHCILAVVLVGRAPEGGAVVEAAGLGRLLFVDPTADSTPVGTLPRVEEESLALVVAPEGGPLVRLPDLSSSHRVDRTVDVVSRDGGAIEATVHETRRGQPAAIERGAAADLGDAEYQQRLERRVAEEIPAARVSGVAHADAGGAFELSMKVMAAGYAQVMQDRLLVFKPPFGLARALPSLSGAARTTPVVLEATATADTLRLETPAGFTLDELPQAASIDAPFGRYTLTARQDGAKVVVERSLVVKRARVPAGDYAVLRAFVEKVRAADTSPVVFVRKWGRSGFFRSEFAR